MIKSIFRISILILICITACTPTEPAVEIKNEQVLETPEIVVSQFFLDWINFEGNPLVDEIYKTSGYLSQEAVAKLETEKSQGGWIADPITCAQDRPTGIEILTSTMTGDQAAVMIKTSFETKIGIDLIKQNQLWLIDNITCIR